MQKTRKRTRGKCAIEWHTSIFYAGTLTVQEWRRYTRPLFSEGTQGEGYASSFPSTGGKRNDPQFSPERENTTFSSLRDGTATSPHVESSMSAGCPLRFLTSAGAETTLCAYPSPAAAIRFLGCGRSCMGAKVKRPPWMHAGISNLPVVLKPSR